MLSQTPEGVIADRLAGGLVRLQFDASNGQARVLELPEQAEVVHTFWFGWVAFYPKATVFGPTEDPPEGVKGLVGFIMVDSTAVALKRML